MSMRRRYLRMTLWKNIYQKMLSNVPSNIFQKRIFNSGVIRLPLYANVFQDGTKCIKTAAIKAALLK